MPAIFLNYDLRESHSDAQISEFMPQLHMATLSCHQLPFIEKCSQLAEAQKPIAASTGAFVCPIGNEPAAELSLAQFRALLEIQLIRFASAADLNHIKLHSALLQLVENSSEHRVAFLEFVRNRCLISIICPIGSELEKAAVEARLPIIPEVMLDAHYTENGKLLEDGGIDSTLVITRLDQLQKYRTLTAEDGTVITLPESYDHLTVSLTQPAELDTLKAVRTYLDAI